MKEWLIGMIVEFLLKTLTKQNVEALARQIQCFIVPMVRAHKEEIIKSLMEKAKKTNTKLDDAAFTALDVFFESFLPDTSHCFADLKK